MIEKHKKTLLLIPFYLLSISIGLSQNISGFVMDRESSEPLIGATISDRTNSNFTTTNNYGYFEINCSVDSLTVSYIGYIPKTISTLSFQNSEVKTIYLTSNLILENITISGNRNSDQIISFTKGYEHITNADLVKIPYLLGVQDVIKALSLKPGVQAGTEGTSNMYVRGGSNDHNLILLDGTPVYNASHLFGFVSTINTESIKSLNFYKSYIPSRYSGRLSSTSDIRLKEGNFNTYRHSMSLGLLSSGFSSEGPIIKNKLSYSLGYRRTLLDLLAKPILSIAKIDNIDGDLGFYDITAKLSYKINDKNILYFSFYNNKHNYSYSINEDDDNNNLSKQSWGEKFSSHVYMTRYNRTFNNGGQVQFLLAYIDYKINNNKGTSRSLFENNVAQYTQAFESFSSSGLRDNLAKIDYEKLIFKRHYIRTGLQLNSHNVTPFSNFFHYLVVDGGQTVIDSTNQITSSKQQSLEGNIYLEDDFRFSEDVNMNVGVNAIGIVGTKRLPSIEPRVSLQYLSNKNNFSASYSRLNQYIIQLQNENIGVPFNHWILLTEEKSQSMNQFNLSWSRNLGKHHFILSEIYYRDYDRVYQTDIFFNPTISLKQSDLMAGKGRSYGVEVSYQFSYKKVDLDVNYSLSKNERKFESIYNNNWYPFKQDRRHILNIISSIKLKGKNRFSFNWVLQSGNIYTLPDSRYILPFTEFGGFYLNNTSHPNNFRLKPYHRLDVMYQKTWEKKKTTNTLTLGLYNTYANKNPFYLRPETISLPSSTTTGNFIIGVTQFSVFTIIPSISYKISF